MMKVKNNYWVSCLLVFLSAFISVQTVVAQEKPTAFPQLTGHVVDNAGLLNEETEHKLTQILSEHEAATGNQVVVATIDSLNGENIDEYSNQLFRHWGLGQKNKDNGVLLLVALSDRKMRIEVGYGLEGELTDATASLIISEVLRPAFRAKEYDKGVIAASQQIVDSLNGEAYQSSSSSPSSRQGAANSQWLWFVFLAILVIGFPVTLYLTRKIKKNPSMNSKPWRISASLFAANFFSLPFIAGFSADIEAFLGGLPIGVAAVGGFLLVSMIFYWIIGDTPSFASQPMPVDQYKNNYSSNSYSSSSSSSSSSSYSGGGGSSGGGGASGDW